MSDLDAQAAVVTGQGRGGVATVLVTGVDAHRAVLACFQPATPRATLPEARILYGLWRPAGAAGESVVVVATGPDRAEVHCHGGRAAVSRVLQDLASVGCAAVEFAELMRAAGHRYLALETESEFQRARTRRTAALLWQQTAAAGADGIVGWAEQARAALTRETTTLAALQSAVRRIVSWAPWATRLTGGWHVVLAGAPNVGKSSLLNALVGFQRAITFDAPGTTRDVLAAETVLEGWPITLRDTAGLRESDDAIEREGVTRARQTIATADLVLLVVDSEQRPAPELIRHWSERVPVRCVHNKADRWTAKEPLGKDAVATVATTGTGVEELATTIVQALVPRWPAAREPMPVTERQARCLHELIEADSVADAQRTLERLIEGPDATEARPR